MESALGVAGELGRWFVGAAILLNAGVFLFFLRRHRSATIMHKALLVFMVPVLGIPWATARSSSASAVCIRCGRACTGFCGRAGPVVCGGYGFAAFWNFSVEEALLGNHSAQSPASV